MPVKPSFVGMFVVVLGKESWRSFPDRTNSCFKEDFHEFISFFNIISQLSSFAECALNASVCMEEYLLQRWVQRVRR